MGLKGITGLILKSGDNLISQAMGLLLFLKIIPVENNYRVISGERDKLSFELFLKMLVCSCSRKSIALYCGCILDFLEGIVSMGVGYFRAILILILFILDI